MRIGIPCCRSTPLALALALAGCGAGNQAAATREAASAAYNRGLAAFANRDYAAAASDLAIAVDSGGLNVDAYCSASVKLAVCYVALGKFDEAHALLDQLEAGAPNMDEVLAARSFAFKKQTKNTESRAALAKARQFNRAIKEFP